MDCQECKQSLYPDNPEVSFYLPMTKKWLPPMCWSCNNYQNKTLEKPPEPPWVRGQWEVVGSLRGQIIHLENKVIESSKKRKKLSIEI